LLRRAGGEYRKKIRGSGSGTRIDDLPNGKIRFGAIYGAAGKLNLSPQQVDAMSMWQFFAMIVGQMDDGNGLSSAEADDLWEWLKSKE
jgi:hypothetical protein